MNFYLNNNNNNIKGYSFWILSCGQLQNILDHHKTYFYCKAQGAGYTLK